MNKVPSVTACDVLLCCSAWHICYVSYDAIFTASHMVYYAWLEVGLGTYVYDQVRSISRPFLSLFITVNALLFH